MNELSPLETFEQALRNWWLVVLVAVWGAAVGWTIHSLRPPLYEAQAVFNVSMDFNQTGRLTQFEEDHAWNAVGALLSSTSVFDQAVQQANQQGIPLQLHDLLQRTSIERKEYIFVLKVRDPNPQTAATLANLWANEANRQLTTAYGHAQKAQALQRYQATLEDCLSQVPALPPASQVCSVSSLADLQAEIQSTNALYTQELVASRQVIPAVSFQLANTAAIPQTPVSRGQNSQVLAGALIGFVVGVWAVQVRLPLRLARRLRHA